MQAEFGFFSFALGAAVTFVTQIIVRRYHVKLDNEHARINDLCECIQNAVDVGLEYWTAKHDHSDILIFTAKVKGAEARLTSIYGLVSTMDSEYTHQLEDKVADLYDALTGGDFEVAGRDVSPAHCFQICKTAASLETAVRRLQRDKTKLFS